MKKFRLTIYPYLIAVILCGPVISNAQVGKEPETTPEESYKSAINNPGFVENAKGEGFCWHARGATNQFITRYEETKNTKWLDAGFRYCDFLISRMEVSPDGYKGWVGPFLSDNRYWQDVLVGDALLFDGILDYCILVNEDNNLKKIYGVRTKAYIASVKRDFVEKYDKRGTWMEDGPYGGYINSGDFLKEGRLKEWIHAYKTAEAGVSHPFNKQMDAGLVCIKLHRVTGEKLYRDRAEKIFFTVKSHFQYFDNHYCWNYYEPLYPGDVDLERKDTRHGIWVHPWRSGYQASEVDKIVEAYHYGIVFDEQDMRRIINTNLQVMWNKDKVNPKFINSNGLGADGDTTGIAGFQRAYGHSNVVKNGGELWTALLDFDQTIRELYELRFKGDKTSPGWLHYKNTVLANPPGFKRKYAKGKITVPVINFTESSDLYCAVVLPHVVARDGQSIILCKSWKGGDLQIDLYSTNGKKVKNLYSGKIGEGVFITRWDGKDPENKVIYKGEYRIRWTIGGGYREFPVVVSD
ncbi:MAG: hypothetical protein ABI760_20070 [Ferruginibacter sp.]